MILRVKTFENSSVFDEVTRCTKSEQKFLGHPVIICLCSSREGVKSSKSRRGMMLFQGEFNAQFFSCKITLKFVPAAYSPNYTWLGTTGHIERVVSCPDVTWRAKCNLGLSQNLFYTRSGRAIVVHDVSGDSVTSLEKELLYTLPQIANLDQVVITRPSRFADWALGHLKASARGDRVTTVVPPTGDRPRCMTR